MASVSVVVQCGASAIGGNVGSKVAVYELQGENHQSDASRDSPSHRLLNGRTKATTNVCSTLEQPTT